MPDYDAGFKIVAHVSGRGLAELGGIHCRSLQALTGEVQATQRLADRVFRAETESEKFVVYMEAYTRWQESAPWSVLAKSGLLAESPGLMALYPLCRHGRSRKEAISYPAQVITERVADRKVRADLLTSLGVFGRLTISGIDVFRLIGREQMKESPFYQEIMEEGEIKALQGCIFEVLKGRFGAQHSEGIKDELKRLNDVAELTRLHRLAVRCRSLAEFRRAVRT